MDFKSSVKRLNTFGRIIHRAVITLTIIEACLGIAIGYVSGNITTNNTINKWFLVIFIILLVIYIPLFAIKIIYTESFPLKLADELKAERELKECKENAKRQEQIGLFFINSMKNLNGGTCALDALDANLCDTGINNGVKNLVSDLVDNIGFVLNSVNTKSYTVGFYLNYYLKNQHLKELNTWDVITDYGTFVLVDGLNKEQLLTRDIIHESGFQNEQLQIHSILCKSFNNNKFVNELYEFENKKYSMICSPITEACDKAELNASGVLFIISNKLETIPSDTENNLRIFNRIIANYIFRYNECVGKRHEAMK